MSEADGNTPDQTEGNTLHDDLREAFAAISTPDDPEEQEAATPDPGEEPEDGESEAPEDNEPEASDAPDDVAVDDPDEAIEPPARMSDADKETFAKLPRDAQEYLTRRHKEMEADYTRKTQEVAPLRKALEPFRGEMERLGMNEAQAMQQITAAAQQLFSYQSQLQQDPRGTLTALAKQFGIDLAANNRADEYIDPDVKALRERVQQFEQVIVQGQQQSQQQQMAALQAQIAEFAETHPHFEALRSTMSGLMTAGSAKTLDDAYEKAQWSHPEIREKILSDKAKAEQAEAGRRRQEKAKSARAAGTAVKSSGKAPVAAEAPASIGDTLREEIRRQMSG